MLYLPARYLPAPERSTIEPTYFFFSLLSLIHDCHWFFFSWFFSGFFSLALGEGNEHDIILSSRRHGLDIFSTYRASFVEWDELVLTTDTGNKYKAE